MNIKSDELLREIDNVLQKRESINLPCQNNTLKEFKVLYLGNNMYQRNIHVT